MTQYAVESSLGYTYRKAHYVILAGLLLLVYPTPPHFGNSMVLVYWAGHHLDAVFQSGAACNYPVCADRDSMQSGEINYRNGYLSRSINSSFVSFAATTGEGLVASRDTIEEDSRRPRSPPSSSSLRPGHRGRGPEA